MEEETSQVAAEKLDQVPEEEPKQEHAQLEKVPAQEKLQDPTSRITTNVAKTKPAKNPGRVAAGKRLVEWNRRNRETKRALAERQNQEESLRADEIQQEPAQVAVEQSPEKETSEEQNMSGFYLLSIAGFLVSLLGLHYKRHEALVLLKGARTANLSKKPVPEKVEHVPEISSAPPRPKHKTSLINMD